VWRVLDLRQDPLKIQRALKYRPVKLNGSILPGGPDFRQGVTLDTNGTYTLIVWLGLSATTPQTFEISK